MTCRCCGEQIRFVTVETPGYLPRAGWSDGHPSSPLVCFKAIRLTHEPAPAVVDPATHAWNVRDVLVSNA